MRRGLVVALPVAVLVRSGTVLDAPPLDPAGWSAWVERLGPVAATLAIVRVGALLVAAWLAIVAVVAAVARAVGAVRLAGAVERALPPALRRGVAGLGLASAVALGGASTAAAAPPEGGTATMTILPDADAPPAPAPAPTPPPVAEEDTWTVEPGDSFWSIAEEVMGEALGRDPTDGEVERYWRALVEANRDRLLTANPDLIVAGQVFRLPLTSGA